MAQLPVSCDSLGELDEGLARAIIDKAIEEAVFDLEDRGRDDGKPRQVDIKIDLSWHPDGHLIVAHIEAAPKVPRRRTRATMAKIGRHEGQPRLLFQQYSPDDPNQRTFDEVENKAQTQDAKE